MEPANPNGIDVSHYQGDINWAQVAEGGIVYAMIKASQGSSYVDPMFATNWNGAKTSGLQRGAYHYFMPTDSFIQQADLLTNCLNSVSYDANTDMLPAIDCEELDGCSPATYSYALAQLLQLLERQLGVKPMIYASPGFWSSIRNPDFTEYPLWLADYTDNQAPTIPEPWTEYALWQYSNSGSIDGIEGAVDLDRCPEATGLPKRNQTKLNWF
ncbi:glycoside hydrolase family 25 protein [Roseibium algae]|uniref:GH25 family lysozyme n=1 Tax=Roseibium algae TaxID=3123038 RepID=A0ABU8TM23_9HYPH